MIEKAMQNTETYISQLAEILRRFQSPQNLKINEEISINAYNFDCAKKEILCGFLAFGENDLAKSADAFYYDESSKTIYLIEWTEHTDKGRSVAEFVKKFAHSLLILGFLTGCCDSNFRQMNVRCWAIRNETKTLQRISEFSALETRLRKVFISAEVRYNAAQNTKDELARIQSKYKI